MPYCKECGNLVEMSGSLCSNCQNQGVPNEISMTKPKKKARSRPLTLSRGLKYPRSIIFVIILILVLNLESFGLDISVWIDWRSFEDLIILIIPLMVTFSSFTTVYFDEDPRKTKYHWAYIVLIVLLLWNYRYFLIDGIEFLV